MFIRLSQFKRIHQLSKKISTVQTTHLPYFSSMIKARQKLTESIISKVRSTHPVNTSTQSTFNTQRTSNVQNNSAPTHKKPSHPTALPNQLAIPPVLLVTGKGILRNNQLIESLLQAQVKPWQHYFYNTLLSNRSVVYTVFKQLLAQSKAQGEESSQRKHQNKHHSTHHTHQSNQQITHALIGWGNKNSYQTAKKLAKYLNLPAFSLEDGFLRSLDSGTNSRHGLSMVVDDIGIYFDLRRPSRLEQMILRRIEQNTGKEGTWSDEQITIAQRLIHRIMHHQLSKYNASIDCPILDELVETQQHTQLANCSKSIHVLLIDQVFADCSVAGAGANQAQFKKMLEDVLHQHQDAHIWIKTHPAGKQGYLTELVNLLPEKTGQNLHLLTENINPIALLKQVSHVYTVSSHMGFEALLLQLLGQNIQVHCYGMSWYAGWGVTDDKHVPAALARQVTTRRQAKLGEPSKKLNASIEQLFFAAYLDYSHYVDPASKSACGIDDAINWLITNRHWQQKVKGSLGVYEFSRWKVPFVRHFLSFPYTELFIKPKITGIYLLKPVLKKVLQQKLSQKGLINNLLNSKRLQQGWQSWQHKTTQMVSPLNPFTFNRSTFNTPIFSSDAIVAWGLAQRQKVSQLQKQSNQVSNQSFNRAQALSQLYCMEDGFIRSNGLGSTLLAPLSVVLDGQGIYYNATQASDLESLIQICPRLTCDQEERVKHLTQVLLKQKISKYNVGKNIADKTAKRQASIQAVAWMDNIKQTSKRKILIVGQVEDDLSVRFCGSNITTNVDLIQQVRLDNPEAFIVYKPHPDVETGLRTGKVTSDVLKRVNAVAKNIAMPDCLTLIDEVHTISSLTGFEALLRSKRVVCYGLPFYAGWRLTTDKGTSSATQQTCLQRRMREQPITLQQLIHCTLIDYPLYRLPDGYGLAQVEQVVEFIHQQSQDSRIKWKRQLSLRFMQVRHQLKHQLQRVSER